MAIGERDQAPDGATVFKAMVAGSALTGLLGMGSLVYATGIEPGWIEVSQVSVPLKRLAPEFDGYRIVQVSDLHGGEWMPPARLAQIVDIVNGLNGDLIALTGDYVTHATEKAITELLPPLSRLSARDGVVGILGNHDYWGRGHGVVRELLRDSGVIDLNNKVHTLERDGAPLHLAGVDSARERMDRIDLVLDQLPREGAAVLLAHEPDFADVSAATRRFDFQMSGHSHGGQVVVPFVGPPNLPPLGRKYHTGRYRVREMALYTNRGLGVVGLPVRFFCRPEITVFTLTSSQAAKAA